MAPNGAEVHASLRFAILGDGTDPLSVEPDGVYLVGMQLTSTQSGLAASDPYYFVLYKNAVSGVLDAVNALGVSASAVQFADVPEPDGVALADGRTRAARKPSIPRGEER